jgi:DNA polymerase III epsilon subunit-like protein
MQPVYPRRVPYASRPLIGIDIETNGLKAGYHEIIELALAPLDKSQTPWVRRFKMRYPKRSQDQALRVAKYNADDWSDAVDFEECWHEFEQIISGATLVGHNAANFDHSMIKGQALMLGLDERLDAIRYDIIDTQMLARTFLVSEGLKSLSLKACREFFGKSYEGAHAAYDDAVMALELYEDILSRVKYHGKPRQESLF